MTTIGKSAISSRDNTFSPAYESAAEKRAYRPSLITRRSMRRNRRENRAL